MPKENMGGYPFVSRSGTGEGRLRGRKDRTSEVKPGPEALGECVCPLCRTTILHLLGTSCLEQRCPKCGAPMMNK
jgi:hypothetical protein